MKVCTYLSANHPYNTHWVSLRFTTSFIHFSSVQSTRCPQFGVPCGLPRLRVCHGFCVSNHRPEYNKNTRQTLASHCCCLSPFHGFLASTVAGARSQFRSFLSPLAYGGTPPGYSVAKCATQLCFFLAAGAITFLPTHRKTFPQITSV